jgi:hypothetical protein
MSTNKKLQEQARREVLEARIAAARADIRTAIRAAK